MTGKVPEGASGSPMRDAMNAGLREAARDAARVLDGLIVDQARAGAEPPREYRVTFGFRFDGTPSGRHPMFTAAHRDGWLTVVATSYEDARDFVVALLSTGWADIYGPGDGRKPEQRPNFTAWFPLGELGWLVTADAREALGVGRNGPMRYPGPATGAWSRVAADLAEDLVRANQPYRFRVPPGLCLEIDAGRPGVISAPGVGDTLLVDDVLYRVAKVEPLRGAAWRVTVEPVPASEPTGEPARPVEDRYPVSSALCPRYAARGGGAGRCTLQAGHPGACE